MGSLTQNQEKGKEKNKMDNFELQNCTKGFFLITGYLMALHILIIDDAILFSCRQLDVMKLQKYFSVSMV